MKAGQAALDRQATIVQQDPFPPFDTDQQISFGSAYYIDNTSAEDFTVIAEFDQDQLDAISSWNYGNGTVYFFSDFSASFQGNLSGAAIRAAASSAQGFCRQVNMTSIEYSHLVKSERYLSYESKLIKMKLYLWE
jgi:hypothetical protein